MSKKLLQMDFPVSGPWGEEMTRSYRELAETIARTPGLIGKIWTENEAAGEAGGIYLFENEASLVAYLEEHTARLREFGITEINAKIFDVNEGLSEITRGAIG